MSRTEKLAYDEHLNAIMIQNDVLETAKTEGHEEGFAEGRQAGMAEGTAEGLAEGKAKGLAEGEETGRKNERTDIARKMKEQGMPADIIESITGIRLDD